MWKRNEMTKPKKPKLRRSRPLPPPPRRTLYAAYSAAAPFTSNVHVSFDIAPALGSIGTRLLPSQLTKSGGNATPLDRSAGSRSSLAANSRGNAATVSMTFCTLCGSASGGKYVGTESSDHVWCGGASVAFAWAVAPPEPPPRDDAAAAAAARARCLSATLPPSECPSTAAIGSDPDRPWVRRMCPATAATADAATSTASTPSRSGSGLRRDRNARSACVFPCHT
jgi:hypothetical protein